MSKMLTMTDVKLTKNGSLLLDVHSLSIHEGETIGLIGPNGAGKSTLLKTMALLEEPTAGRIALQHEAVWPGKPSLAMRRRISVVFQQPLMFDATVFHNVSTGLRIRGESRHEIDRRTRYWLERFNISHLAKRHAKTLSGGEAQRVSLARAFAVEPDLLLLDEPFSALDLPTKKTLLHDIRNILLETGVTTVFVSHDYQEIRFLCARTLIMNHGKCIGAFSLEEMNESAISGPLKIYLDDWMTPLNGGEG